MQRIAITAQPVQQRLLRQDRHLHFHIGRARSGVAFDDDGRRDPPNPSSPRAKLDRFWVQSGVPSAVVTRVSLRITAALTLSKYR